MEITMGEISVIMRILFFLRSLPEKIVGREEITPSSKEPLLSYMLNNGFTRLAEVTPREIVFGLIVPGTIGRVWQKSSALNTVPADDREFLAFNHQDYVRVVANLLVEDTDKEGFVIVRTESRCHALSPQALKNFTPYWRTIRPFSGLIRRVWLRGIKRRAEQDRVRTIGLTKERVTAGKE
jgi:hypothetical protein